MQATKHASEGSILALKPRGDVIRSPKQGVSVAPQKGHMSSKILKKIKNKKIIGRICRILFLVMFFF